MSVKAIRWALDAATQHGLNQTHRIVLVVLGNYHHERTGTCFPSVETVARDAGLSVRRAQSAIRAISSMGLIHVNKRSVRGVQRSNQYDLFGQFRDDGRVTPKTGFRGDGGGTPNETVGGDGRVTRTSNIYIGGTDDANVVPFATAKELKIAGGAK